MAFCRSASQVLPIGNDVVLIYMSARLPFHRTLFPLQVLHCAAWTIEPESAISANACTPMLPKSLNCIFGLPIAFLFLSIVNTTDPSPAQVHCAAEEPAIQIA